MSFLSVLSIIKQHRAEFIALSIIFYAVFALGIVIAIIFERKNALAIMHNAVLHIKQNKGMFIVFSLAIYEIFALGIVVMALLLERKIR